YPRATERPHEQGRADDVVERLECSYRADQQHLGLVHAPLHQEKFTEVSIRDRGGRKIAGRGRSFKRKSEIVAFVAPLPPNRSNAADVSECSRYPQAIAELLV